MDLKLFVVIPDVIGLIARSVDASKRVPLEENWLALWSRRLESGYKQRAVFLHAGVETPESSDQVEDGVKNKTVGGDFALNIRAEDGGRLCTAWNAKCFDDL